MSRNTLSLALLGLVLAAVAAVAGWRVYQARHPRVEQLAREGYMGKDDTWADHARLVGRPAPSLDLTDWRGQPVTPDAMRGKIVVIDFWATWCEPCLAAVPHNNAVAQKYRDKGVLLVGACGGGEEDKMKAVADEVKMEYPTGKASEQTTTAWGVQWWPHYAIVDRRGNVRALGVDGDYVERIVDALLKE